MAPAEIRVLHLADVFLGAAFPWLGERGAAQRRQIRESFSQSLHRVASERVHLLLIAGNLFASPRPGSELTGFVASHLARLGETGTQTVIVSGAADSGEGGPYVGGALDTVPGVTILPATPAVAAFRDPGVSVAGRSFSAAQPDDALRQLQPGEPGRTIALLHVPLRDEAGARALARVVEHASFAYVALGGSPGSRQIAAAPPAWYAGSPEIVAPAPGGAAMLVKLRPDGVTVTPLQVGRRRYLRLTLEPAAFPSTPALVDKIERHADPDLILDVRLEGRARPEQFVDVRALGHKLAPRFFALTIDDHAVPDLSSLLPVDPSDITVPARFAALMAPHLRSAAPDEQRRAATALRLGLWLLGGRDGGP